MDEVEWKRSMDASRSFDFFFPAWAYALEIHRFPGSSWLNPHPPSGSGLVVPYLFAPRAPCCGAGPLDAGDVLDEGAPGHRGGRRSRGDVCGRQRDKEKAARRAERESTRQKVRFGVFPALFCLALRLPKSLKVVVRFVPRNRSISRRRSILHNTPE